MVHIKDTNLEEKIKSIEGTEWIDHHNQWIQLEQEYIEKTKDLHVANCTIWSARKKFNETQDGGIIYGLGGWNRYHVRGDTGEVVFSEYHCMNLLKYIDKVHAAGFRFSNDEA